MLNNSICVIHVNSCTTLYSYTMTLSHAQTKHWMVQ